MNAKLPRISFHGAAETVTGSRTLIESEGVRLLVDCGLFQGHRELRSRNWSAPGFDPASVDAVVLTHAHIDHSGYLPRLVREGFRGSVYTTPATADLLDILLRDSARIQEEDAEYANKKGFSKHKPALPLYTVADAERAIGLVEVVDYSSPQEIGPGLSFSFHHAGHIIGSGMIELELGDDPVRILLSGDVGRYDAPLVPDPSVPKPCDYLVIESTYGDRRHPESSVEAQLQEHLERITATGGTLLVPSFAVGRAQQLIFLLREVMDAHPTLEMPIHLDSPMAVNATKIYRRYPEEVGLEDIKLQPGSSVLYGKQVFLHRTRDESMRLNRLTGPRVIISSSGMMTGGRILHHLRNHLPDEKSTVVLAGYQAPGTRGWRLERGERELKIHGRAVQVRAHLGRISGLSAHADRDQLLRWVRELPPPRTTFVTHGDPDAAGALASALTEELGFRCAVPEHGEGFELGQAR